MSEIKLFWDCIYGSKSHLNLAGKLLIAVPLFPFVAIMTLTWVMLDAMFTKEPNND